MHYMQRMCNNYTIIAIIISQAAILLIKIFLHLLSRSQYNGNLSSLFL